MPTDEQIKAAANVLAGNLFGQTLSQVPCSVVPSLLSLARAALEAAERVAWCDDMSRAPHDELLILGWNDKRDGWVTAIDCASWGWQTATASNRSRHSWATHWRSLPEPPQ